MLRFQASDLLLSTWANKDCMKCRCWIGIFEPCRRVTVGECHWLKFMPWFPGEQGPCCLFPHTPGEGEAESALIGLDPGWSDPESKGQGTEVSLLLCQGLTHKKLLHTPRPRDPVPPLALFPRGHMPGELWVSMVRWTIGLLEVQTQRV